MRAKLGLSIASALLAVACASLPEATEKETDGLTALGSETLEPRLKQTLSDLAAFGYKRAGTPAAFRTADYVADRFRKAGLSAVHFEQFTFPVFQLASSSMSVAIGGETAAIGFEVLGYSGSGNVDADVVYVGKGRPVDYEGKDVRGKVVLVDRDATLHRSVQLTLVAQHGGSAMIYASTAPSNLVQIGTVSLGEGTLGPAPAISVGADDAAKLREALSSGRPVHATINVNAQIRPGKGRNVVGTLEGSDPSGAYLLVGAHYDTWYTGSYDNSAGVAAALAIAEDFAARGGRKLGLRFVGYDAEEVGLYGGYDYLRKHVIVGNEPMLAFVNFETPANDDDGLKALGHTNGSPIRAALVSQQLPAVYPTFVGMERIQLAFGGVVPTDIQGMYRNGIQGLSTFSDSPYYHTVEDTPDKVNTSILTQSVSRVAAALDDLDSATPASFDVHDPTVWRPAITTSRDGAGNVVVDVVAKDSLGAPQSAAVVRAWVDVHDFTLATERTAVADANGAARLVLPLGGPAAPCAARWLHVTAGKAFPLAEHVEKLGCGAP